MVEHRMRLTEEYVFVKDERAGPAGHRELKI
jgi:hypothetical protein